MFTINPSICPFTSYELLQYDPYVYIKTYNGTDITVDTTTKELLLTNNNFKANVVVRATTSQNTIQNQNLQIWKCGAESISLKNDTALQIDLVWA